jgi:hypothetical protein
LEINPRIDANKSEFLKILLGILAKGGLGFTRPKEERSEYGKEARGTAPHRRWGQAGNLNALKHGFYSKHFLKGEIMDLEEADDLQEEIGMMTWPPVWTVATASSCRYALE